MSAGEPIATSSGSTGWGDYVPDLSIASTAHWVGTSLYGMVPNVGLATAIWGSEEKGVESIEPKRITTISDAIPYRFQELEKKMGDSLKLEWKAALRSLLEVITDPLESVPNCKAAELAKNNCDAVQDAIRQTKAGMENTLSEGESLPEELEQLFAALNATAEVLKIFPAIVQANESISRGSQEREKTIGRRKEKLYQNALAPQKQGFDAIIKKVGEAIETAKEQLEQAQEKQVEAYSMALTLWTTGPRGKEPVESPEGEAGGGGGSGGGVSAEGKDDEAAVEERPGEVNAHAIEVLAADAIRFVGIALQQCDIVDTELPSAVTILTTSVEE